MGHETSLAYDIGNFYTGITLAMPILAGQAFTASKFLKYDHLKAFNFFDQLRVHNRLCHMGSADFNGCSIIHEENVLKLYLPAWIGIKQSTSRIFPTSTRYCLPPVSMIAYM